MPEIFAPLVQRVGRFNVVRDDMFTGGTKARVLKNIFHTVSEHEIVYAGDRYGYAGLALAEACAAHGKKATVFFNDDDAEPDAFLETKHHAATQIKIRAGVQSQIELFKLAEEFAAQSIDRKIYPIGFRTPEFQKALTQYAETLPLEPKEIWALAGSGTLLKSLRKAWPDAIIHAVSMGFRQTDTSPADHVYHPIETPEETAIERPPYKSASRYDAKLWSFVRRRAATNALIWNVA